MIRWNRNPSVRRPRPKPATFRTIDRDCRAGRAAVGIGGQETTMVKANGAGLPERIGNILSLVFLAALAALFGFAYLTHFFG